MGRWSCAGPRASASRRSWPTPWPAPRACVLRTQGIQSESDLAFSALHQLLRPVVHLTERLNPNQATAMRVGFGERPAGERNDRFLVYSATLGLVAEAAETQPVLCVVDDAQWLDEESANALLFTARRLGVERVAMLFAARDQEETEFERQGCPPCRSRALPERSPCPARGVGRGSRGRGDRSTPGGHRWEPAGPRRASRRAHRGRAFRRGASAQLPAGDRRCGARLPGPSKTAPCPRADAAARRSCRGRRRSVDDSVRLGVVGLWPGCA